MRSWWVNVSRHHMAQRWLYMYHCTTPYMYKNEGRFGFRYISYMFKKDSNRKTKEEYLGVCYEYLLAKTISHFLIQEINMRSNSTVIQLKEWGTHHGEMKQNVDSLSSNCYLSFELWRAWFGLSFLNTMLACLLACMHCHDNCFSNTFLC